MISYELLGGIREMLPYFLTTISPNSSDFGSFCRFAYHVNTFLSYLWLKSDDKDESNSNPLLASQHELDEIEAAMNDAYLEVGDEEEELLDV